MAADSTRPFTNMPSNTYACDLCNLPVEISGFELMTRTGLKRFCCEGCVGVYEMLNGDAIISDEKGEFGKPGDTRDRGA